MHEKYWKLEFSSDEIQAFLSVGGENGILVKKYLKIPISPLWSIYSKIPKTPLKIGTFQNPKSRGGENGMIFPGGENGISRDVPKQEFLSFWILFP